MSKGSSPMANKNSKRAVSMRDSAKFAIEAPAVEMINKRWKILSFIFSPRYPRTNIVPENQFLLCGSVLT